MNWLVTHLLKEARGRRFNIDDKVRYFTDQRKGKGKGVVLTPAFNKGTVVNYNNEDRRYQVRNDKNEVVDVHPRNLIPDSFMRNNPVNTPQITPSVVENIGNAVIEEEVLNPI